MQVVRETLQRAKDCPFDAWHSFDGEPAA